MVIGWKILGISTINREKSRPHALRLNNYVCQWEINRAERPVYWARLGETARLRREPSPAPPAVEWASPKAERFTHFRFTSPYNGGQNYGSELVTGTAVDPHVLRIPSRKLKRCMDRQ